jgi:glycosyltransferase involved in cell wall biosynthesis/2-polyprenyl-3-methyl-5-hydroxy-6-metoxy-1,4-benzoquinol methylase
MSKYSPSIDLNNQNSSHTKIIHLVGRDKKVLEFGCAAGHMSAILKDQLNCQVVGIEINPEDAQKAVAFCQQVIIGDIETYQWCEKLGGEKFDVAIFSDVLEHLKDPKGVLIKAKNFLNEDGYILASVPNVANISIRLELLLGSFEYEELGILDDSHLKYFTLKSLINTVRNAGFYIDLLDFVIKDLPVSVIMNVFKTLDINPTEKTIEKLTGTNSLAYQIIVKALNRKPDGYVDYVYKEIEKPERIAEKLFREHGKMFEENRKKLEEADRWLREKDHMIQEKDQHLIILENKLREKEVFIEYIQSGDGWKILERYYKLRDYLFPLGSKKRMGVKIFWNLRRLVTKGKIEKSIKYIRLYGLKEFKLFVKGKLKREILRVGQEEISSSFGSIGTKGREVLCEVGNDDSMRLQDVRIDELPNTIIKNVPQITKMKIIDEDAIIDDDSNVSIIIPAFNGAKDLTEVLPNLNAQKGLKSIEIIVIDSGSTDKSVEVCRENGAKVIKIPQKEFSHSYARNLGATEASKKYLLFMVQDALPSSNLFINRMLRSLKNHSAIAVSCGEFLRIDADLFAEVQQWGHRQFLGMEGDEKVLSLPEKKDYANLRRNSQISDVACLIEKIVFLKYKYRNDYAEDLDLGLRLIKDHYKLVYINTTKVIHSHTRPAYYILKRSLVDNTVLSKLFSDFPKVEINSTMFCEDIMFMYGLIGETVSKRLSTLKMPCRSDMIRAIVMESIEKGFTSRYPREIKIEDNPYIDWQFLEFIKKINEQYDMKFSKLKYKGKLLMLLASYVKMTFDYLTKTYEIIDLSKKEDIISCLYKILAIVIGTEFAFIEYNDATPKKRDFFTRLQNELSKGV